MSITALSPYEIIDVQIIKSLMDIDTELLELPPSTERPLEIKQDFILLEDDDHDRKVCELRLWVDYKVFHERQKGSRRKSKPVVTLQVGLRGMVAARFEEHVSEGEQEYYLRVNATSLLFAEARTHLLSLTSLSPVGKVILPAISPYALVDDLIEKHDELPDGSSGQ